jgi:hypothetical protein
MMAFNFMNTLVKSFIELRPGGGLQLAVLGARIVEGSHVASGHGREECHSFVPAGGRDQSTQKIMTRSCNIPEERMEGTRQAFVCGQVVPFLVQRN